MREKGYRNGKGWEIKTPKVRGRTEDSATICSNWKGPAKN